MPNDSETQQPPVRARLLEAARRCFLSDEYHAVSTRQVAELAQTNVSMIRYYFGNKEGLYEEMIRETYRPLFDLADTGLQTTYGYADIFHTYYESMSKNPEFPKLILKVLALNQGPGHRFILQFLERGRILARQTIDAMKITGEIDDDVDADMVRMLFVSLAMTPMLLKSIFEEQLGRELDETFLERLAQLSGHLFVAGLRPARQDTEDDKKGIRE